MAVPNSPILIYSIQRTYIIKSAIKQPKGIVMCDQRIDIPTIEPLLTRVESIKTTIIVPCIELAGDFLKHLDLTFETNEGVTVLPVKISSKESPYGNSRYVLVLPRGATGVKSCNITFKGTVEEVPHNFTFGIMPPPYNYDNALLGIINSSELILKNKVENLERRVTALENKAGG